MPKYTRPTASERRAVTNAQRGMPTLAEFIAHPAMADFPRLQATLEGIWCGREGTENVDIEGSGSVLVIQWYRGRVEVAYVS